MAKEFLKTTVLFKNGLKETVVIEVTIPEGKKLTDTEIQKVTTSLMESTLSFGAYDDGFSIGGWTIRSSEVIMIKIDHQLHLNPPV